MADDPDFKRYLEVRMHELKAGVEELLDMHDRYGDTLQKQYLWAARRSLMNGLEWFAWSRRKANERSAQPQTGDGNG